MVFSMNSRYALQRVQRIPPTSYIFTCLKGNEKALSTKCPKEDISKPPLRLNIPKESPNVESYTKLIRSAQPRSKSLISKSKKSFSPGIDGCVLYKSGSEMHFSSFRQNDKLDPSAHNQQTPPQTTSNFTGIEYSEENPEQNYYQTVHHFYPPKEETEPKKESVNNISEQSFGEIFPETLGKDNTKVESSAAGNDDSKNIYIVIDTPERAKDSEKQFAYVNTCENMGEQLRITLPKFVQDDFEAVKSMCDKPVPTKTSIRVSKKKVEGFKGNSSQTKLSPVKGERGKTNSKVKFQVHEIDDSSTYVFQLKFKKGLQGRTCAVGCVPEKEINTRKMDPTNADSPVPICPAPECRNKSLREVPLVDDHLEYVKCPDWKVKAKSKKENSNADKSKSSNAVKSVQNSPGLLKMDKYESDEVTESVGKEPSAREESNSQNYGVKQTNQTKLEDQRSTHDSVTFQSRAPESVGDLSEEIVNPFAVKEETADKPNSKVVQASPETDKIKTTHETVQNQTSDPLQAQLSETQHNPETVEQNQTPAESDMVDSNDKQKADKMRNLETKSKSHSNRRTTEDKIEAYEPESTDFQTTTNIVRIQSERPPTPQRYSAGLPKYMNKSFKNQRKGFGIIDRDSVFGRKCSHRSDFDSEKRPAEIFRNPLFFSTKETDEINSTLLKKKDDILHVYKGKMNEDGPKIADNMVNVANEDLTEDKGKASIDSLAMMKQLKEIVDFDLKNAVKIFQEGKPEAKEDQGQEETCQKIEAKNKTPPNQNQDSTVTVQVENPEVTFNGPQEIPEINHEPVVTPKHLSGERGDERVAEVDRKSDSVIDFNAETEKFIVNMKELENAIYHRRENFDETYLKAVCQGLDKVLSDEVQVVDIASPARLELKTGDSILIFDETTQTWKVDYSILEKRRQQIQEEEELTRRSQMILETFEKLEQGKISNIPRPSTRERKTFDYSKEEWKTYRDSDQDHPGQKSSKSKLPFKESDAEEIRKRNSDMYDDLFIANKKDVDVNKEDVSETSKPKKIGKPVDGKREVKMMAFGSKKSGDSGKGDKKEPCKDDKKETPPKEEPCKKDKKEPPPKEEPGKDDKKETPPKEVPCKNDKKEPPSKEEPCKKDKKDAPPKEPCKEEKETTPKDSSNNDKPKEPDCKEGEEEGEGWEAYIKEDIPPLSSVSKPVPERSTVKAPTVRPNIKKIDPTILKIPPLAPEITNIPPSKIVPPPKGGVKIDEPKFRIPLPFGRKKKIDEPSTKPGKTDKAKTKDPKDKPPSLISSFPGKSDGDPKTKVTQTTIKTPPTKEPPKGTDPKSKPPSSPASAPKGADPKSKPPVSALKAADPSTPSTVPTPRSMEDPKSNITPSSASSNKEHYVSDNIVEMSKYGVKDKNSTNKSKQFETVKLNITSDTRTPSKITEINLNKTGPESMNSNASDGRKTLDETSVGEKCAVENKAFYRNFEKYKTPFSDPEFEEKSVKINSDMESNPNLKKLENWNKTLVLHDTMKPPENVESWLKDETDKMATLLLKVLQEAADGKPKRKPLVPKSKLVEKATGKANPYDNIRKKQENTPEGFLFKVRTVNFALGGDANAKAPQSKSEKKPDQDNTKDIPVQSPKTAKSSKVVELLKMPEISMSESLTESQVPSLKKGSNASRAYGDILLREPRSKLPDITLDDMNSPWVGRDVETKLSVDLSDDIPGPEILKKISGTWKMFPVIGCQATIFTLLRIFQLVNLGTSFWNSSTSSKPGKNAFTNLFTKYGPIVNLQGPLSGNIVLIHKPEHLSGVFEQDTGYSIRSIFDSLEQSRREAETKILTVGISTDWNKSEWNDLKKASNDPLVRGCEKFFRPVEVAGESLISNIRRNRNNQNLVSDDFMKEIKQWSMEGLCTVLFEKSFGFLEGRSNNTSWLLEPEKFFTVIEEATEYLSKCERGFQAWRLMSTPSSLNLNQAYRSLYTILSKQLYQAELNLKNKNELLKDNSFIGSHDLTFLESMLLNDRMTVEDIICNVVDFLLIGVNTMSSALGFMLYNLAQNVKVQGKLLKEVKEMLPDKTSRLDYRKLHSLKYLQACLKESLRLNSPVPVFFRVLQNDIMVSNYVIPKETYVVMDFKFSNMKEQVFENPEKFLPERWLNDEKWLHDNPLTSLPLCHGPRAELARRVVEMQLWSCIARVVRNFQIEYHYGEIQGTENVFSHPDKPLKLNFIERDE